MFHNTIAESMLCRGKYEWTWDKKSSTSSIVLSNDNMNVTFHPVYSTGTAVAKGSKPLEFGRHHYWEILIGTQIYGTDVMIGVGTAKAELHDAANTFCALLGRDKHSWGYSYKGYLQHEGEINIYTSSFNKNDLIGVHLDTWNGSLQFFLNRRPLGIAFTRLSNVTLYPLISSTMAQCEMKLMRSHSVQASLQTACLAILSPSQKEYLIKMFPILRYLVQNLFADILRKRDVSAEEDMEIDFDFPTRYIILDDFDYALVGFGRKQKLSPQ